MSQDFMMFAGTANGALATAMARELGVPSSARSTDRFPAGQVEVQLLQAVRRKEVSLAQPTSPSVNDQLVELLSRADTCRRAVARSITAVTPCRGYGRSDERAGRGEPNMARVTADLRQDLGVDYVVTGDPHPRQIEGFSQAPVDTLTALPTLRQVIARWLPRQAAVIFPGTARVRQGVAAAAGDFGRIAPGSSHAAEYRRRPTCGTERTAAPDEDRT